ncbi:MAG: FHA domain-containing protein [Clostridiales bacterium]|nr:FHA domain-containing protein [Clostridiales bacterium]
MNLVKCDNEHFFDSDKFDSCPHCANLLANVKTSDLLGRNQKRIETVIPDESCLKNYQKIGHRKVTGWLVCIEGEMKGDSFTLFEGLNHIGRAANMDVALFKEPTVSRENHALLEYKKDTNTFILTASPDVETPILHNNNQLKKEETCFLSTHDILILGECKLCFIPFCDESFIWTE